MHETERHRVILAAAQSHPVVTVAELCEVTGSSEATIRRDIAALDEQGRLRRVRGGAEALNPPAQGGLMGRPPGAAAGSGFAQGNEGREGWLMPASAAADLQNEPADSIV